MLNGRTAATATLLPNGRVLIAGGWNGSDYVSQAELYDPSTGTFSATGSMLAGVSDCTATLLGNGQVLVAGGYTGSSMQLEPVAKAQLYDPSTGTFSATGSMATARVHHTATLLRDGRVLIAGGGGGSGDTAGAELYDPATGTFSSTGSMREARGNHAATLLPDGRVLVAGGDRDEGGMLAPIASAEIYDPATGRFQAAGSMATRRSMFTATLLKDGRVLLVGGWVGDTDLSSAETYDPGTGAFRATGSMSRIRLGQTATRLLDGRVLVVSGNNPNFEPGADLDHDSAEIYDPSTAGFSWAGLLTTLRPECTATLLPDGSVLIAGGQGREGFLSSAELYVP